MCFDGGDLILCSGCPRAYHYQCLDKEFKAAARGKMQFHCPQHECVDCQQKTSDAGGMIYRCRWCERGYCEDCLDFDKTTLLGDNLKEYDILGFPAVTQAFYMSCPACKDHLEQNQDAHTFCQNLAKEYDEQHKAMIDAKFVAPILDEPKKAVGTPSRAESLTDATTLDESGISTPQASLFLTLPSSKQKRKAAPVSIGFELTEAPTEA